MSPSSSILGSDKAVIGMVHVAALPGTPRHTLPMRDIIQQATEQAKLLVDAGFDAIMLENMHDAPYVRQNVGPEIIASMTAVAAAVRDAVACPLGIQILAGANRAALAVAHAAGLQFIRAEGFVFASVADEGLLDEADAGPLLRYRKMIGAEHVAIFADIKKKHSSHAITADVDISETTKAAEFFSADGIIITGIATGQAICMDDLKAARAATALPILVGSGVTPESVKDLFTYADAVIVGSWYKKDGLWSNPPNMQRCAALIDAANHARSR